MSELKKYNLSEFENYIKSLRVSRKISRIQLHHTYSPAYKNFTGSNHITLQTGMRNYHINTNGWSDIGQHFTVFPDGAVVTGRSVEMIPAGIKGANTGSICIECLGNFDKGGDTMNQSHKNAIVAVVKILLDKFNLNAKTDITYHGWWSSSGTSLGDYSKTKSIKTCPGTNFFGGNTKAAFEKNLLPLIENYGKAQPEYTKEDEIKDIVDTISAAGIITNRELWLSKCNEDINVYWLCKKTANYIKNR